MVSALVTTRAPTTTSTLSATGSDQRTALGSGDIRLVAGGLAHRGGRTLSYLDQVQMTVKTRHLPSIAPAGLAALVITIVISAGTMQRRASQRG